MSADKIVGGACPEIISPKAITKAAPKKPAVKVQCECGTTVSEKNISNHRKTKKHLSIIEEALGKPNLAQSGTLVRIPEIQPVVKSQIKAPKKPSKAGLAQKNLTIELPPLSPSSQFSECLEDNIEINLPLETYHLVQTLCEDMDFLQRKLRKYGFIDLEDLDDEDYSDEEDEEDDEIKSN